MATREENQQQNSLQPYQQPEHHASVTALSLLNPQTYGQMMEIAKFMAGGDSSVPKHLKGKPADCLAVLTQAMVWGMLPHVVAQKTHVSQSGILGYEAQLVNAVAVSSGALKGQPQFEFIGDWTKVRGKSKFVPGEGDKKGYYQRAWSDRDEEGLGVKCIATLRGESEPRVLEVFLTSCHPRFSTNWAIDPEQQITYVAVRRFMRRHSPGAILGVYTPDELDAELPPEKVDENTTRGKIQPDPKRDIKPAYPDTQFTENLPAWTASIGKRRNTHDSLIKRIEAEYTLTDAQKAEIRKIPLPAAEQKPGDQQNTQAATNGAEKVEGSTQAEYRDK